MKSAYIKSKAQSDKIAQKAAKAEIERQMKEFCPNCLAKAEAQTIAVMCKALNVGFGFGKKRLQALIESAEGIGTMMHDTKSDYNGAVKWLKDEMGIDLTQG